MESGVDPVKLAKYAESESTPISDYALAIPGNIAMASVPPLSVIPSGAYIAGLLSDIEGDESKKKQIRALIPGVGSYRMGNRIRSQVLKELDDIEKSKGKHDDASPIAHSVAEHIGPLTSTLTSAAAGAGVGLVGGPVGAAVGGVGGGLAALIAQIAALRSAAKDRRRTSEEQIEADKGSVLAKYLIPGKAAYGMYKRLGRSQGDREEKK